MMTKPDFSLLSKASISKEFISRGISTFQEAAQYIKEMPYGRNENKYDLLSLLVTNRALVVPNTPS